MSSTPDQWYAQLSIGVVLGPMPLDDLRQLAATGAILSTDKVRPASTDEWQFADAVPGLKALKVTASEPPMDEGLTLPDDVIDPPVDKQDSDHSPEMELDVEPTEATSNRRPAEVIDSNQNVEVEAPRRVIAPRKPASPDLYASELPANEVTANAPPTAQQSLPTSTPLTPPRPTVGTTTPAFRHPSNTSRRRFPKWVWPIVGAVSLMGAIAVGSMLWPSADPEIYTRYSALYRELQERRAGPPDADGWDQFVLRAQQITNETVPWLEQHADPGDRKKCLLLYAGRDIQAAIAVQPDAKLPHQKRLEGFMSQLDAAFVKR